MEAPFTPSSFHIERCIFLLVGKGEEDAAGPTKKALIYSIKISRIEEYFSVGFRCFPGSHNLPFSEGEEEELPLKSFWRKGVNWERV